MACCCRIYQCLECSNLFVLQDRESLERTAVDYLNSIVVLSLGLLLLLLNTSLLVFNTLLLEEESESLLFLFVLADFFRVFRRNLVHVVCVIFIPNPQVTTTLTFRLLLERLFPFF